MFIIGNVIGIDGEEIKILMNDYTNLETHQYNGELYNGISMGTYLGIIRGSDKLIVRVEKEFLEDKNKDVTSHEYLKDRFERVLETKLIGTILDGKFSLGVRLFPMIYNDVVLLTDREIESILIGDLNNKESSFYIGRSLLNDIPIHIPWDKLFNTHMGIFGNTGSGKSNTLTKLYSGIFDLEGDTIGENFNESSKFFVLDFNGEYMKDGVLKSINSKVSMRNIKILSKKTFELNTSKKNGEDKILMKPTIFWNSETLSIMFNATEKTQKPFLSNAINTFFNKNLEISEKELDRKLISAIKKAFLTPKSDTKKIVITILKVLINETFNYHELGLLAETKFNKGRYSIVYKDWVIKKIDEKLNDMEFETFSKEEKKNFYKEKEDIALYDTEIKRVFIEKEAKEIVGKLRANNKNKFKELSAIDQLKVIVRIYLLESIASGEVEIDHINPLLKRIDSKSETLKKIIKVGDKDTKDEWNTVNVISLKNCNQDAKKLIPLLLAKQLYEEHKEIETEESEITATKHLIIDEAHNILSEQSNRESSSWKDYRLEVFEEIIKEGRKFGFYITLSSQRPCDISQTIVSQLHNFFIHRLVNDNDLRMINNAITSIDSVSKARIPTLAAGQCIITGTSFEMPILIKVDRLNKEEAPTSDNADLIKLWCKNIDNNTSQ